APVQHAAHRALGAPDRPHTSGPASAGEERASSDASDHSDDSLAKPSSTSASGSQRPSSGHSPSSRAHASGIPAAGSVGGSAAGLCRAWTAQGGHVNPKSAIARSLNSLAGGPAGVAAYCQAVLAAPHGHSASASPSTSA